MPKTIYKKRVPRRSYKQQVPRPFGKYNEDAYIKCDQMGQVVHTTANVQQESIIQFRIDGQTGAGIIQLSDNAEWTRWAKMFASYQVIGMRLELQLISGQSVSGQLFAGQTAALPVSSVSNTFLQGMPLNKRVSQDGALTSIYYPFQKDLVASGYPTGMSTQNVYSIPLAGGCVAYVLSNLGVSGAPVANWKMTWYVKFHGTRYNAQ